MQQVRAAQVVAVMEAMAQLRQETVLLIQVVVAAVAILLDNPMLAVAQAALA
jgi:hypothetical protein